MDFIERFSDAEKCKRFLDDDNDWEPATHEVVDLRTACLLLTKSAPGSMNHYGMAVLCLQAALRAVRNWLENKNPRAYPGCLPVLGSRKTLSQTQQKDDFNPKVRLLEFVTWAEDNAQHLSGCRPERLRAHMKQPNTQRYLTRQEAARQLRDAMEKATGEDRTMKAAYRQIDRAVKTDDIHPMQQNGKTHYPLNDIIALIHRYEMNWKAAQDAKEEKKHRPKRANDTPLPRF